MVPVVTPEEMKAIDRGAAEPVEVLIERAGAATARAALEMLGGTYGRRVVVVAGKGNNGADGRAAAGRLTRAGVRVAVIDAADAPGRLPVCDLVIDAAYGTGFHGDYGAPDPGGAPVLAVDIPSGVDGLTGESAEGAVDATRTVSFAALKPGLLLGAGVERAGDTSVVDIGLDVSAATMHLVHEHDVGTWLPPPSRDSHKWRHAVWVLAGSPGMTGAAQLCARGAMRAGGSTVRLGVPGTHVEPAFLEVVGRDVTGDEWGAGVLDDLARCKVMVVGPGIGRREETAAQVRKVVSDCPLPVVVDADALWALGDAESAARIVRGRRQVTVFTPHDGEYERMHGSKPPADRVRAVRELAAVTGATVLLKGATTVVADPEGQVMFSTAGDSRLATAGSGDVLAGVIGAFMAQGLGALRAAAGAAVVHGAAAHLGWRRGLVAGDLPELLPAVIARVTGGRLPGPRA